MSMTDAAARFYQQAKERFETSTKKWFVIDDQDEIAVADFDTEEECYAWIDKQENPSLFYPEENRRGKASFITHVLVDETQNPQPGDLYGDFYTHPKEALKAKLLEKTERFITLALDKPENTYKAFYWKAEMPNSLPM